jgi:hypothetical protein
VPKGPRIKSGLSDPVWAKAPVLTLPLHGGEGAEAATGVRILFDKKYFYAGIVCGEPLKKLKAQVTQHDGPVYTDDSVEIYISPHPEVGYKQLVINSRGTVLDLSSAPDRPHDKNWSSHAKVAVSVDPGKCWKVAVAIPFKTLEAYAGNNQTWRLNICRNRANLGGYRQEYSWAKLPGSTYHVPHAFGVVEGVVIPDERGDLKKIKKTRSVLIWEEAKELTRIRSVYTHPFDPDQVWCASSEGLLKSTDNGYTWHPVKSASVSSVGTVTCMAFSGRDPRVIYMGTNNKGLYLSTNSGMSWTGISKGKKQPASSHIEWVDFCPSDPSWRTLQATHGTHAPGFSVSRDLGTTWEVLGQDRYLKQFVKQAETVVATGSMVGSEGKVWGIHRSGTDGQRWEETVRDIDPSEGAVTYSRWQFLYATLDGKLLHSFNDGKIWKILEHSDRSSWSSLFFTYGITDKDEILAAYDPFFQGLVLSRHRFTHGLGEKQNNGLYVGPYVKSGAQCRVNANGLVYYVAMNNRLFIGRWGVPDKGPFIKQTRCIPPVIRIDYASEGNSKKTCTLQAQIAHAQGLSSIQSVTADCEKLGNMKKVRLFDDGKHNDGSPNDGLYGANIEFLAYTVCARHFFSRTVRNRIPFTVTVRDVKGSADSWALLATVSPGPQPIVLYSEKNGNGRARVEGPVELKRTKRRKRKNEPLEEASLTITASGSGPWRAGWLSTNQNIAGLAKLSFYIQGTAEQELFVQLMDHHVLGPDDIFDEPHFSGKVPLKGGGYLRSIKAEYQKVTVPVTKLFPEGVFFLRWHGAGFAFSTEKEGKPGVYHIRDVVLEP